MKAQFFVLIPIAFGETIYSPTRIHKVCRKLVSGANGKILSVVSFGFGETEKGCDSERLILKCSRMGTERDILNEVRTMEKLSETSWVPKIYESFQVSPNMYCFAMDELGIDLQTLRDKSPVGQQWSWLTLGRIGVRAFEILKSMHIEYGIINTRLRSGHWVLDQSGSRLNIVDFGYAQPISTPRAPALLLEEVRQLVISLRYLWDGDVKFYMWKFAEKLSESSICAGTPDMYCETFRYVCRLRVGEPIDNDLLINNLTQLVEEHGGVNTDSLSLY